MKKIKNKIKCVVFDLDGTIFDTEKIWKDASLVLNKKYNIKITDEFRAKCCGRHEHQIINFFKLAFPNIDAAAVRKEWVDLVEKEIETNGAPIKKGFVNLLKFLQKNNIILGLATGSDLKKVELYFEKTNFDQDEIFSAILTIEDYKKSKPHPEIYKTISKRLKIKPKFCVGIEDSPNGAKACWRAGFNTILVPDVFAATRQSYKKCVGVFNDLNEVKKFLQDKI